MVRIIYDLYVLTTIVTNFVLLGTFKYVNMKNNRYCLSKLKTNLKIIYPF